MVSPYKLKFIIIFKKEFNTTRKYNINTFESY